MTAALAKGSILYVCAGPTPYTEALSVDRPVTIFGALDCTTWAYKAANKTQLTAAADSVPLTLTSAASGTQVNDFTITAADAMMAGGSSIAVLDNGAGLTLENVDIDAGAAKDGVAGAVQSQVPTPASASGSGGTAPTACTMTNNIMGGTGGTNACNGSATNGGYGGAGTPLAVGGPGGSGQPMTPANGGAGQGATSCKAGGAGNDGTAGAAGTGAHGLGDVSASGYQPPAAVLGGVGTPGQGGGGGGGALACDPNDVPPMFAGPSGGGGGAGGCGGMPGNSGTSGGSSIGILALGANLTLTTVAITTKAGGAGGLGSNGQLGGNGGAPGNLGGGAACGGGKGGQGGAGGPGGGGAGGHSIGITVKGGAVPSLSSITITPGSGGMGGPGGDMTAQTQGDAGKACKTLDFDTQTCATM
jgi:hypothetical protein